jgi:hypothetical protein
MIFSNKYFKEIYFLTENKYLSIIFRKNLYMIEKIRKNPLRLNKNESNLLDVLK